MATSNNLTKNTSQILLGSIGAQAINLALYPILTRIYSPEAFGIFSILLTIIVIIGPASTLRYDAALLLPKQDNEAFALYFMSLGGAIIFAVLISIAIFVLQLSKGYPFIDELKGHESIIWLIPCGIISLGMFQSASFLSTRTKQFIPLSKARIMQALLEKAISIAIGLGSATAVGLLAGRWLSPLVASLYLGCKAWRFNTPKLPLAAYAALANRYKRFPLIGVWGVFLDTAARELPTILLGILFSPITAGQYALATRIIGVPLSTIGEAAQRAYLHQSALIRHDIDAVRQATVECLVMLIIFAMPTLLPFIFLGKDIFGFFFGSQWALAGVYTQYLGLSFMTKLIMRPICSIFVILEKQLIMVALNTLLLIFNIMPIFACYIYNYNDIILIISLAISSFTISLFIIIFTLIYISSTVHNFLSILKSILISILPSIFIYTYAYKYIQMLYIKILIVIVGVLLQYAILILMNNKYRTRIIAIFVSYSKNKR